MSRKNFGAKPFSYPQPVLIIAAYGENDVPSAMNAAWGGISDYKEISMDLSKGHKTVKDLRARGAFTVSMGTLSQMVACDYVGVVSGNKVPDKVAKAGWHVEKSSFVDATLSMVPGSTRQMATALFSLKEIGTLLMELYRRSRFSSCFR